MRRLCQIRGSEILKRNLSAGRTPRRQMCLTILYQRVLWFRSAEIQRPLPLNKIRRNVLCQFNTEIGVSVGEARTS